MSSHIIPYIHNGDALPPDKVEWLLQRITNSAYGIERDIQALHEIDLNDLRKAQIVTEDNSVVSGIQAFSNLARFILSLGNDAVTESNNKRFLCQMLARGRG